MIELTKDSLALLIALVKDAPNWGGTPMIGYGANVVTSSRERGNLTDLKVKGLITTFNDYGDTFVSITEMGRAVAAKHADALD
jgi:hypothetical protein